MKGNVIRKIFDKINRDRNENEYNKTEIQARAGYLIDHLNKFQFDLNKSGAVRILEAYDSQAKRNSYFNK